MKAFLVLVTLALAGCGSSQGLVTASSKFSEAVTPTVSAYQGFIMEGYTEQADTHMRVVGIDPSQKVDPLTLNKRSFSKNALQVRLDAIRSLTLYSQALAKATSTDLGAAFKASAVAAGAAFDGLQETIDGLDNGTGEPETKTRFGGPVGTSVGVIGQTIIEKKQAEAVKTAIQEAAPGVATLIKAMEEDVALGTVLHVPNSAQLLAAAANAYNSRVGQPKFVDKVHDGAFAKLQSAYQIYRDQPLRDSQLIGLLKALGKANNALLEYASAKGGSNESLGEVIAAVDELTVRARELVEAIEKLRS